MAEDPADKELRGRDRTVLVLDDDDAIRASVRRLLELHDFQVLEAATGPEAFDLVVTHPGPIHLLLCDLILPGIGGRETANRIMARHPDIAVLYMSGYSSPNSFRRDLEKDGAPFLSKPFEVPELLSAIGQVLGD